MNNCNQYCMYVHSAYKVVTFTYLDHYNIQMYLPIPNERIYQDYSYITSTIIVY